MSSQAVMEAKVEALERGIPFNERLIDEVAKFPVLYQNRQTSIDAKKRKNIWDTIAETIDPVFSGEFAKRRWLQIRDRYRKELKVVLKHGYSLGTKWKYFKRLSWLEPHLKDLDTPGRSEDDRTYTEKLRLSKIASNGLRIDPFSSLDGLLANSYSSPETVELITATVKTEEGTAQPFPSPLSEDTQKNATPATEEMTAEDISDIADQSPLPFNFLNPLLGSNDWANDEDLLFGRMVAVRIKKMQHKRAKKVRASILAVLDESDDEEEEKRMNEEPKLMEEEQ